LLEIVNVAARRCGCRRRFTGELAASLDAPGFGLVESDLSGFARWTARGFTACDSAYVAIAEGLAVELVTDDDLILAAAPRIAAPLAGEKETTDVTRVG
jgi:hypothetical protein